MTVLRLIISPAGASALVALAVIGPLLGAGRILTLDSPVAINWDVSGFFWGTSEGYAGVRAPTYASAPLALGLKALGGLISIELAEKLWLGFLIWASAFGASRLPGLAGASRYYAGALYAVNPFPYVRLVSGQWGVFGAYALTPFLVISFVRMLETRRPRDAILVAALFAAVSSLQVHAAGLSIILLGAILIGRAFSKPRLPFKSTTGALAIAAAVGLGLISFWMIRLVSSGSDITENMPLGEMLFYSAWSPIDVVTLRGFWISGAFLDITDVSPVWWISAASALWLAAYGAVGAFGYGERRWLGLSIGAAGVVGVVLAIGPSLPLTRPVFEWLWGEFAWYRAFRDSHKFVALLALAYAYLGAVGLGALFRGAATHSPLPFSRLRGLAPWAILLIPLSYGAPMFGTLGQLKPAEFPPGWHNVREILDQDESDYSVLVLPWHMYAPLEWLPNRMTNIAVPVQMFFARQEVISADNWETPTSYTDSNNPVSRYVERFIVESDGSEDFSGLLAPLNAKYVMIVKTTDYERYDFLWDDGSIQLIEESDTIALFRNLRPVSIAYLGDQPRPIFDIASFNYLTPLQLVGRSPLSYRIEIPRGSSGSRVVLSIPQQAERTSLTLDGAPANGIDFGFMPGFDVDEQQTAFTVSHERLFWWYGAGYAISLATAFLAAAAVWRFDD